MDKFELSVWRDHLTGTDFVQTNNFKINEVYYDGSKEYLTSLKNPYLYIGYKNGVQTFAKIDGTDHESVPPILGQFNQRIKEEKVKIIASDSMINYQTRVYDIELLRKIDGTNTLTFKAPKFCYSTTGEKYDNDFLEYLHTKAKLKLLYKNKWYDFIINIRKEEKNKQGIVYSFECNDLAIEELSKNGYTIVLTDDVDILSSTNNVNYSCAGTLQELTERILIGSDWTYDSQRTTAELQEYSRTTSLNPITGKYEDVSIPKVTLKQYYSPYLKKYCNYTKFYYNTDKFSTVAQSLGESIDPGKICTYDTNHNYSNVNFPIYFTTYTKTFCSGSVKNYIAYSSDFVSNYNKDWFYVNNNGVKQTDDPIPNKKVTIKVTDDVVDTKEQYSLSLRTGKKIGTANLLEDLKPGKFMFRVFTGNNNTPSLTYNLVIKDAGCDSTSTEKFRMNNLVSNQFYAFEIHDKIAKSAIIIESVSDRNVNIVQVTLAEINLLTNFDEKITEFNLTNVSYPDGRLYTNDELKVKDQKILYPENTFLLDNSGFINASAEVKKRYFFEPFKGLEELNQANYCQSDSEHIYAELNEGLIREIDEQYINEKLGTDFLDLTDTEIKVSDLSTSPCPLNNYPNNNHIIVKDNNKLNYYYEICNLKLKGQQNFTKQWARADLLKSNQKSRMVTGQKSNRYSLLVDCAEKFKVYPNFEIIHNPETGEILYDRGIPKKLVYYTDSYGKDNFLGFKEGLNLEQINRDIISNEIVTKMYVESNTVDYNDNGMIGIQLSDHNAMGENYIYNFRHYFNTGILDKNFEKELKSHEEIIGKFNKQYKYLLDDYQAKKNAVSNSKAAIQSLEASVESQNQVIENLIEELEENNQYFRPSISGNKISYTKGIYKEKGTKHYLYDSTEIQNPIEKNKEINAVSYLQEVDSEPDENGDTKRLVKFYEWNFVSIQDYNSLAPNIDTISLFTNTQVSATAYRNELVAKAKNLEKQILNNEARFTWSKSPTYDKKKQSSFGEKNTIIKKKTLKSPKGSLFSNNKVKEGSYKYVILFKGLDTIPASKTSAKKKRTINLISKEYYTETKKGKKITRKTLSYIGDYAKIKKYVSNADKEFNNYKTKHKGKKNKQKVENKKKERINKLWNSRLKAINQMNDLIKQYNEIQAELRSLCTSTTMPAAQLQQAIADGIYVSEPPKEYTVLTTFLSNGQTPITVNAPYVTSNGHFWFTASDKYQKTIVTNNKTTTETKSKTFICHVENKNGNIVIRFSDVKPYYVTSEDWNDIIRPVLDTEYIKRDLRLREPAKLESYIQSLNDAYINLADLNATLEDTRIIHANNKQAFLEIYNRMQFIMKAKNAAIKNFEKKYALYIKEGYWSDNSYSDNDAYYFDATSVSNDSSLPRAQYTLKVIDLSPIKNFENYNFNLGDETFAIDKDIFGSTADGTPIKEKVTITELKYCIDNESKNTITLKNYSERFEELFQRITAAVTSVEKNSLIWDQAKLILENKNDISALLSDEIYATTTSWMANENGQFNTYTLDEKGLTFISQKDSNYQLRANSVGIFLTKTAQSNNQWTSAISAEGINASAIRTGILKTSNVSIMSDYAPLQTWNGLGITAYKGDTSDGGISEGDFVRFDQFGMYVVTGEPDSFGFIDNNTPWFAGNSYKQSVNEIKSKAKVAITIDGFSYNSNPLHPDTNIRIGNLDDSIAREGIEVKNKDKVLFQVDNLGNASIAGWNFTEDTLFTSETAENYKKLFSDLENRDNIATIKQTLESFNNGEDYFAINVDEGIVMKNIWINPDGNVYLGNLHLFGGEIDGNVNIKKAKIGPFYVSGKDNAKYQYMYAKTDKKTGLMINPFEDGEPKKGFTTPDLNDTSIGSLTKRMNKFLGKTDGDFYIGFAKLNKKILSDQGFSKEAQGRLTKSYGYNKKAKETSGMMLKIGNDFWIHSSGYGKITGDIYLAGHVYADNLSVGGEEISGSSIIKKIENTLNKGKTEIKYSNPNTNTSLGLSTFPKGLILKFPDKDGGFTKHNNVNLALNPCIKFETIGAGKKTLYVYLVANRGHLYYVTNLEGDEKAYVYSIGYTYVDPAGPLHRN